ncbi:hypothetical protein [Candidatus Solirubrobacter pratensis]|jgi:hypothetical protein|uniref:hypothetical protein n=1 Tax=Candidatus Solirubrobacter pratensis TaxID=1298857 RepID=UPI0012DDDDCA|nr:hypothetical protein [Candidatus Solirubrobacter pratensis]
MAIRDMFPGSPVLAPLPLAIDELIEEMLDYYAEWRQEAAAVDEMYRYWCAAPIAERDRCFVGYNAALDQEQSAAMMYAVVAEEVRAVLQRSY